MKIAIVTDFFSETHEYQENLQAKYYAKHGHEVTVITSTYLNAFDYYSHRNSTKNAGSETFLGPIRVVRLPYRWNILNKLKSFRGFAKALNQAKPELIFAHDVMPDLLGITKYMTRNRQACLLMGYHADASNSGKNWLSVKILHGVIRKWILYRSLPFISRILPVVPAGVDFLNEIYAVPHSRMEVLPLGVDSDRAALFATAEKREATRNSLGIGKEDIVIFTGGKITPEKRTHLLLDAVVHLNDKRVHVLVAGDADANSGHQEYMQQVRAASQGSSKIHFLGWQSTDGVYSHMAASDIAVFPASQSILWQQAIGMGLPLIVGDSGQQDPSYLNLNHNVIILPKDRITSKDIAASIQTAMTEGTLNMMKAGAQKTAHDLLNWNTLVARTLSFYGQQN